MNVRFHITAAAQTALRARLLRRNVHYEVLSSDSIGHDASNVPVVAWSKHKKEFLEEE